MRKLRLHMVENIHPERASLFWFVYIFTQVEGGKSGGKKPSEQQTDCNVSSLNRKLKQLF